MKPVGGLPDPRGSLSSAIPSQEIAAANKEVQKESESAGRTKNTALLSVWKSPSTPVNMVQLQQRGITQGS